MMSESSSSSGTANIIQTPGEQNESSPTFEVAKHYAPQGEWTLHRLVTCTGFLCHRCNKQKKAKLVATRHNQWDEVCCNGCYGELLSKGK
ncbi:uncharacterized protein K460DRAFT_189211 [Cucurbitaria berberidis CBS 394.84]|uniref:Uncharacterized protein n=1 Tax=Cucurbitaria berberidis CBS 394.84 TaxID=1168544 RepID=A0A9P4GCC3_9PLEO|nr:uncharacterized protein K460DRAFT_189211 [Cucurbitaria berberidis CBS 394.84]KAF1842605.1 hypothetical protein K460DRAFT_189211 [Cucurbitaria berberidis CBS 394.84]